MGFSMAFTSGTREDRKEFERKQRAMQKAQHDAHVRAWKSFRSSVRRTFKMFGK